MKGTESASALQKAERSCKWNSHRAGVQATRNEYEILHSPKNLISSCFTGSATIN